VGKDEYAKLYGDADRMDSELDQSIARQWGDHPIVSDSYRIAVGLMIARAILMAGRVVAGEIERLGDSLASSMAKE